MTFVAKIDREEVERFRLGSNFPASEIDTPTPITDPEKIRQGVAIKR